MKFQYYLETSSILKIENIFLKSFCSGDCVPSGLFNVSSCRFGAPVFMSFPHFYNADPFYHQQVEGMKPEKDKHEFFVALEPVYMTF